MPWYLRFPECGLAEIAWSGDYYSLPDDEFVALVDDVAPCFQALLESGEVEEIELPYEIVYPECLEGRNWYTQTDEAWIDAFDECAGRLTTPDQRSTTPARTPSRVSSSTAPNSVCTSPPASTTTKAGWAGMPKRS